MTNNMRALVIKMERELAQFEECIGQYEKEIIGLKEEIAGQKVQIGKLEDNNRAMKRKMDRIFFSIPNAKKSFIHRPLPAELLNELFAALPLEKAFGILAKMPNGLLARNIRKMLKSVEMALKNNKWNVEDCGPKLSISEEGLEVKHSGPDKWFNCVRCKLPIPMQNLNLYKVSFAYFEVEILQTNELGSIDIGFCTKEFPLENKWLGNVVNSIGIDCNRRMRINGSCQIFENGVEYRYFHVGDVVGIGIVYSSAKWPKMKCFATCNGELLGMAILPERFFTLQLFSAITLYQRGNSIRANFDQNKWLFNLSQLLQ